MTPRLAAVLSLNSAFKNSRFVNLELDSAIKKYGFTDKDRSFYTRLLYGTVERKLTLDYYIEKLSSVSFSKIEPLVLCILETALYQIFYMDKVPDSAACNEATELVKNICPKAYAGYVNAVVRNAARNKESLIKSIDSLEKITAVSVRSGIPEWICRLWEKDYGNGAAEKIAHGFENTSPHLTLRVNTLKISADELFSMFGESLHARKISTTLITLGKSVPVDKIPGYDEGYFFVQDESSAKCAELISPESVKQSDPTVIDTCACPGGKTFAIAVQLKNTGRIYSFDLHRNRLSLIEDGTKRLGITSVKTSSRDARTPDEELFGKADAVLCDVPCSGLGIISKKPDIRFKSPEEIERLPEIQLEILSQSAKYVKPGGFIVYSTCTLRKAENEDNVYAFLKNNPSFSLDTSPDGNSIAAGKGMKTFFPHVDGTDGFFAAKLIKNG